MIERYSRPGMAKVWSDENKYTVWLRIELLAMEKMADLGSVPREAFEHVGRNARYDADRIPIIEAEVKHDVIAFLTSVSECTGPEAAFLHKGMTSSDLLDTAFAYRLGEAGSILVDGLEGLIDTIRARAEEFKNTPCIGRSHGIHAEPVTFGLKLLTWYAEFSRHLDRLKAAIEGVKYGKISGAVGTFAALDPAVEAFVVEKLGLKPEPVSTQIVPRDRHAAFFSALAMLATSIERCAVEIRHLQRTEVHEVEEGFSAGQKGSSAMPHKKNPILSENLSGLSRLIRGYAEAAMDDIVLWHERDISHSSAERVIASDACILMDFMLHRFSGLVRNLRVLPERMKSNLEMTRGLIYSGSLLLALVEAGMTREDAYKAVQRHSLAAWEAEPGLRERVENDASIMSVLPPERLKEVFDVERHFRHVNFIFQRTLGETSHDTPRR